MFSARPLIAGVMRACVNCEISYSTRPTASEIEKNQSLLIFSIVLVNSEKINRIGEKSIANGKVKNQSQGLLKINRFCSFLMLKNQSNLQLGLLKNQSNCPILHDMNYEER